MRKIAFQKHGEATTEIDAQEKAADKNVDKEIDPELIEAGIASTEGMLDKILAEDESTQYYEILPKFSVLWNDFDSGIVEDTTKFQEDMKK